MDPIEGINISKDSTFAMLLEAQNRGYEIHYLQLSDMFLQADKIMAQTSILSVRDDSNLWFESHDDAVRNLREMDVLLMRKDPPFNMQYIYATYILEQLHKQGTLVVNYPASLRNANEKLFAQQFPQCTPPSIVTQNENYLNDFIDQQKDIVVKPLDGMAGDSIFRIQQKDSNRNVILETITQLGKRTVIAQKFIPEYTQGDKRILVINGTPIPYALVRIPSSGELRANLAKGGSAEGAELSERDLWICEQIQSTLIDMQLDFVGIDVIGDYLTEINITSPTGIRELDKMFNLNICATLFDGIESKLA